MANIEQTVPYRRKKKLINQEVQGRLVFHSFILALITLVIFAGVFLYISSENLVISYNQGGLRVGKSALMLLSQLLESNWITMVVAAVLIVMLSILYTHRLVGPFYRYEKTMHALLDKNLDIHVMLRDKDEFRSLADDFNKFTAALSRDLAAIDGSSRAAATSDDVDRIRKHLQSISDVVGQYRLKKENRGTDGDTEG